MNAKLTTGRILISGAFALTAVVGATGSAVAAGNGHGHDKPVVTTTAPAAHGEEADGSDHGATGKPAKADPHPGKGKDCIKHGNHGGINEDHCGPATKPTKPVETTKPVEPATPIKNDTRPVETTKPVTPETTDEAKPVKQHDGQCPICKTVTPVAPVVVPVCGTDNDQVIISETPGVIWERGTWADGTIVIKAISADHYTFPTGDVVTYTFSDAGENCTVPTPPVEDCNHTCPTTPTPEGQQPTPVTPAKPAAPVAPAKPDAPVKHIVKGAPTPIKAAVKAATPAPVATPVEVKGTNAAPVFNAGVEGDVQGISGLAAAGMALMGALALVPVAARRRDDA